jgi:hypothetical protein
MTTDLGHWIYNGALPIPEDFFGFVYLITNTVNGKRYIGKKQARKIVKLPPLKGKNRRRHIVKETDWKVYTSSSDKVNHDLIEYGKDKFIFEIVQFCCSKSELAYEELKLQLAHDVLLREDYYNGIINVRLNKIKKS